MSEGTNSWFDMKRSAEVRSLIRDTTFERQFTGRWVPAKCQNPEHDPPSFMVFPTGEHVHVCPGCGANSIVFVESTYLGPT